jgi:serine/threonine protein kinase
MYNYFIVSRNNFDFCYVIGKGGFGKVWKVYLKKNAMLFALKEMSKTKIIDKRSEKSVKYEKDLLSTMNHP